MFHSIYSIIIIVFCMIFIISSSSRSIIPDSCCSTSTTDKSIKDNNDLSIIIQELQRDFLSKRNFTKLDVVVMIQEDDDDENEDKWIRGMVNGNITTYPASMAKFIYFIAAMNWCIEQGKNYDCLDDHFRPLILNDSNFECGVVVDIITESSNIPDMKSYEDKRWLPWLMKRNYTQKFYHKFDMLKNQVILTKTYPTNSKCVGAELLMLEKFHSNAINPCCASMFLFDTLYGGKLIPKGSDEYSKLLLKKNQNISPAGHGLPAGTELWEKDGAMFPWNSDTVFLILPNGKKLFISFFSDCLSSKDVNDYGLLSYFVIMLIDKLGFGKGLPPRLHIITSKDEDKNFIPIKGIWKKDSKAYDKLGDYYFLCSSSSEDDICSIDIYANIEKEGKYEITCYFPTIEEGERLLSNVDITIYSSDNEKQTKTTTVNINQRVRATYISLGDYNFKTKGFQRILSVDNTKVGQIVTINSFQLSKYKED